MVARTADLPNVRKMFIPDSGHVLIEADFKGAESMIVACECGSKELRALLMNKAFDLHKANAEYIWGPQPPDKGLAYYRRDRLKRCVYAIQNGGKEAKIAELLEGNSIWGNKFYKYWTGRFPEITRWHDRLALQVKVSRRLTNVWGFQTQWLDRVDVADASILKEAIPWVTQSTIANTTDEAIINVDAIGIDVLLQVHDALLMQVKASELESALLAIHEAMQIQVPYPDPLVIPVTIGWSEKSWGELKAWEPNANAKTG